LALSWRRSFPSQTLEEFADSFLTDADPPCDLALANASGFESLNQPFPCSGQSSASRRITVRMSQCSQSAFLKALLMPPHSACATSKGSRDLDLVRPALLHQTDHGMRLSHAVAGRILRQIDPRNEHHTVAILASQQTPLIDNAQTFRVASFGEQIFLLEGRHIR
jgi:hypothetical protein